MIRGILYGIVHYIAVAFVAFVASRVPGFGPLLAILVIIGGIWLHVSIVVKPDLSELDAIAAEAEAEADDKA